MNFKNLDLLSPITYTHDIGDAHSSPMLSFDVYIENGKFGLFEFSPQFGIDYEGHYEILQAQIERAMDQAIKKVYEGRSS